MIIDLARAGIPDSLEADILIAGAGAAGITLALELIDTPLRVIVLDGGQPSDGFGGIVLDEKHPPLDLYRVSGLGGTTRLWGGRCVPLDSLDFEVRAHVPYSGWPISYESLLPWYRRALAYCEAGEMEFDDSTPLIPGFNDRDILTNGIERFSPPTDFGIRYRTLLEQARHVTVLSNARCRKIVLDEYGVTVDHVIVAFSPTQTIPIRARHYVLAAGGLETTRLLLESDDRHSGGIGNHSDCLGRFYMCHLEGKAGILQTDLPRARAVDHHYRKSQDGVYCRKKISISAEAQNTHGLLNMIARIEPPAIADPDHGNAILSAMYFSRHFLKAEYARKLASFGYRGVNDAQRDEWRLLLSHLTNIARDLPALARFAADWTWRHSLARRKLPYISVAGSKGRFSLDYNIEQAPNPQSRVFLSSEQDSFGLRRLVVDWRVSEVDLDSIVEGCRLIDHSLRRCGVGNLLFDEENLRAGWNAIGGHHIGTARMADSPSNGVVDANCQVFGLDNLYIASSAVFPTSGYANPTLTIAALSARLAHFLRLKNGLAAPMPDSAELSYLPSSAPYKSSGEIKGSLMALMPFWRKAWKKQVRRPV